MRGEVVELPGGVTVVNDCYNANPMSMRAALQHLAETPAERRVAVLGTMAELGAGSAAFHREIGEEAAALGIDVLVTVGEEALALRARPSTARPTPPATPEEAGALLEEIALPGDRVLVKGSRSVGLETGPGLVGEILIGGMASLLICIFLGPKFIELRCASSEFGQHIREEGPAGHHEKAGTPTMGGLVHLPRGRRAVPDPERLPRGQPGGVRHRARHGRARLRRRLDEDLQAPLARRVGRTKLVGAGG